MTDELITVDLNRNFGKPMFTASGACVDAVWDRLVAGESLADVAADFELTDLEVGYCEDKFVAFFSEIAEAALREEVRRD